MSLHNYAFFSFLRRNNIRILELLLLVKMWRQNNRKQTVQADRRGQLMCPPRAISISWKALMRCQLQATANAEQPGRIQSSALKCGPAINKAQSNYIGPLSNLCKMPNSVRWFQWYPKTDRRVSLSLLWTKTCPHGSNQTFAELVWH